MTHSLFTYFRRLFFRKGKPEFNSDYQLYVHIIQSLLNRFSLPSQEIKIRNRVNHYYQSSPDKQKTDFPEVYLLLEQFVTESDSNPSKKYSREKLRAEILSEFPEILHFENISFVFQGTQQVTLYLYKIFLRTVTEKTEKVLGAFKEDQLPEIRKWLRGLPDTEELPPFDIIPPAMMDYENAMLLIQEVSQQLFFQIESYMGGDCPAEIWNETYEELNQVYGRIEHFPHLLQLIPSRIMDESKLKLLSRIQIEETLLKQTNTLREINRQIIAKNHELVKAQKEISAAREKEEESQGMLLTILDTVGEGIITIDENSIIVRANREAELMWGYEPGALTRQPLEVLMSGPMRKKHHEGMSRYLQTGISEVLGKWMTLTGVHKNGSTFPIEMKIRETYIGKKRFFTAALHDISERVRKESELKEKNEEMDMLIYKTSHDLRGPITSVLGLVNIIALFPEDSLKYVTLIEKSILKLDHSIRDLMDFGQINNSGIPSSVVNLRDLFHEIIDGLQKTEGIEAVRIEADLPPEFSVYTRKNLLRIIFQNLIVNSIQYRQKNREDSCIRICAEYKNNRIHIRIKDNGQGIPHEFQDRIFEMFFRANSQATGTGLGLYIVKKSIEVLQGTIIMHSEPNEGTEFSLTFPLKTS